MLFFLDFMQDPKNYMQVVIIVFVYLFIWFSWYLKQMLELLNTWFSNIQIKYVKHLSNNLYSTLYKLKHERCCQMLANMLADIFKCFVLLFKKILARPPYYIVYATLLRVPYQFLISSSLIFLLAKEKVPNQSHLKSEKS